MLIKKLIQCLEAAPLLIMHAMSDRFEQAQLKNFSLNSVLKREESAFS